MFWNQLGDFIHLDPDHLLWIRIQSIRIHITTLEYTWGEGTMQNASAILSSFFLQRLKFKEKNNRSRKHKEYLTSAFDVEVPVNQSRVPV